LLRDKCQQQADCQKRTEWKGCLACHASACQLQAAGRGQRRHGGDQHQHGNPCNPDPRCRGDQKFHISEAEPLDFPQGEIQPPQQPEHQPDDGALADGPDAGHCTAGDHDFHQPDAGNRQIQPVRNDAATNIDQRKRAAKQEERCGKPQKLEGLGVEGHASLGKKRRTVRCEMIETTITYRSCDGMTSFF
jgi:hypothetical protein